MGTKRNIDNISTGEEFYWPRISREWADVDVQLLPDLKLVDERLKCIEKMARDCTFPGPILAAARQVMHISIDIRTQVMAERYSKSKKEKKEKEKKEVSQDTDSPIRRIRSYIRKYHILRSNEDHEACRVGSMKKMLEGQLDAVSEMTRLATEDALQCAVDVLDDVIYDLSVGMGLLDSENEDTQSEGDEEFGSDDVSSIHVQGDDKADSDVTPSSNDIYSC